MYPLLCSLFHKIWIDSVRPRSRKVGPLDIFLVQNDKTVAHASDSSGLVSLPIQNSTVSSKVSENSLYIQGCTLCCFLCDFPKLDSCFLVFLIFDISIAETKLIIRQRIPALFFSPRICCLRLAEFWNKR